MSGTPERMATHQVGGWTVHADPKWVNGNSRTGLALAVMRTENGRATPSHVVHRRGEDCPHCA